MRNFLRIADNIDVMPVMVALNNQPELWGENPWRTQFVNTPMGEVNDIWLRYPAPDKTQKPEDISEVVNDTTPHTYDAWHKLPQVRPIVFDLMRRVEAISLGRVLITRLAPGCKILRHADFDGSYRAVGQRYHVVLNGLPGSLFICGNPPNEETVQMMTGSCWTFNHQLEHEVVNNSSQDRIHLLIDIMTV